MNDEDSRIFPAWYAPVMVMENGKHVVKPMRYQCRVAGAPTTNDFKFPGTYNARRDNLEGFWRKQFGVSHGIMVVNAFFENVSRHKMEGRELAPDEAAYRSITRSWFVHSPLLDILKEIAKKKARVIITTDHGTIRVKRPFKIIGDKAVNSNLRYKQGKNLSYEGDKVLVALKPERFYLPRQNVSTSYVFATEDQFFAYPNNYNYYVNFYKDTFQHGGVSLEEMIIPLIFLTSKNA